MPRILNALAVRTGLMCALRVIDVDESFKTMAQDVREPAGAASHGLQVVQPDSDDRVNFMLNQGGAQ